MDTRIVLPAFALRVVLSLFSSGFSRVCLGLIVVLDLLLLTGGKLCILDQLGLFIGFRHD